MAISAIIVVRNTGSSLVNCRLESRPTGPRFDKRISPGGEETLKVVDATMWRLRVRGSDGAGAAAVNVANSGDEMFTIQELDARGDPIEATDTDLDLGEDRLFELKADAAPNVLKIAGGLPA